MVKTTINNKWKNYIYKQIERGVNKKKLEDILKKENYSCDIINAILYSDKIENNLTKTSTNYNDYIVDKINKLELTDIEKSMIKFFKSQSFLKEKIINERIVIIDNWFEEYIANYIYDIFINANYKEIKTSNRNKLNFVFENIIRHQKLKKCYFYLTYYFRITFYLLVQLVCQNIRKDLILMSIPLWRIYL